MSEWSEEATRRSKQRRDAKNTSDAKSLQDRNTLDLKGRALWSTVKGVIGRKCEEFNSEPGNTGMLSLIGSPSDMTLCCTGAPQSIKGKFENDSIWFSGKNGIKYEVAMRIKLTQDGLDVWLADGRDGPVDHDELASDLIETVLAGSGR